MQSPYTLYISARSPFARRVRVLLEELKINYNLEVLDVFNPPVGYESVNPLGRVPVLQLPNSQFLIDSYQIQSYLREQFSFAPIFSSVSANISEALNVSGLAAGIMECTVAQVIESMRPISLQMPIVFEDYMQSIERTLKFLHYKVRGPYFFGSQISFVDCDLGTAIGYCDLRLGPVVTDRYPRLREYYNQLSLRPSFQKSAPPPVKV